MLRELGQRIRDVRQGPDGYLYVLTEENAALRASIRRDWCFAAVVVRLQFTTA